MVAKIIKKQHGLTLVEVVIAAGLLSIAVMGSVMILVSTLGMWSKGVSGTSANTYASIAMRKLVLDIEEGTSAVALSMVTDPDTGLTYGTRLQVAFVLSFFKTIPVKIFLDSN
ncbi:MAG: prepilin-type N-terminal cleavage/methylation domain-containing protein, partial [Armatimonadota bacterium]